MNKQPPKAIDLFHQINNPDHVIYILMFQVCAQLGTKEALDLIGLLRSQMPTSFYSNPRLLTSLINALLKCGDVKSAEEVFQKSTIKELPIYGAIMKGMLVHHIFYL